jgi:hypothetical protein
MAGAGAKKRAEENKQRLKTLQLVILVTTAVYAGIRLGAFRSTAQWYHWAGLILTLGVHGVSYWIIAAVGKPVYQNGELIDGGGDLSKSVAASYSHDVLYVSSMVQLLAAFTNWGWLLYLAIPGYATYKLFEKVFIPMLKPKQEAAIDPEMLKKMEKAERRSERRRMKRF